MEHNLQIDNYHQKTLLLVNPQELYNQILVHLDLGNTLQILQITASPWSIVEGHSNLRVSYLKLRNMLIQMVQELMIFLIPSLKLDRDLIIIIIKRIIQNREIVHLPMIVRDILNILMRTKVSVWGKGFILKADSGLGI